MLRETKISELHPGDHIVWDRGIYRHHAIFVESNEDTMEIRIVHYKQIAPNRPRGEIVKEWVPAFKSQDSGPLYIFHYEKEVYTPDEVLERAHLRLWESRYNYFTNNCESFAHWCKTDIPISLQVIRMYKRIKKMINLKAVNRSLQISYHILYKLQ